MKFVDRINPPTKAGKLPNISVIFKSSLAWLPQLLSTASYCMVHIPLAWLAPMSAYFTSFQAVSPCVFADTCRQADPCVSSVCLRESEAVRGET